MYTSFIYINTYHLLFDPNIILIQVSNYNSITFSKLDPYMNPPNDLLDTNFIHMYIMHETENQVLLSSINFFQVLTDGLFDETMHIISRPQFLVSSSWLS